MARTSGRSRVPGWILFFNPLAKILIAAGVRMGPDVLLIVPGRKTGLPRTTPVAIGDIAGRQWLMSPFGDVDWARNLQAAGRAAVRRGRARYAITARSLELDQRIQFFRDVLDPYLRMHGAAAWIHRVWYGLPDDPVAAAERCAVFEVTKRG